MYFNINKVRGLVIMDNNFYNKKFKTFFTFYLIILACFAIYMFIGPNALSNLNRAIFYFLLDIGFIIKSYNFYKLRNKKTFISYCILSGLFFIMSFQYLVLV